MKTRLLVIITIFVFSFAIPQVFGQSESSENYQLDEPFEIKMDQRIQFEDLELHFYDIEDSRCPLDVTCVWEGKVAVMLNIKNQTHKIGGGIPLGYTISYFTPYEITLVDIQPHPISTEKAEYVATIKISNLDEKKSLCGPGTVYENEVCIPIDGPNMDRSPSDEEIFYFQTFLLTVFSLVIALPIIGIVYWLKNKKFRTIVLTGLIAISILMVVAFLFGIIPNAIS